MKLETPIIEIINCPLDIWNYLLTNVVPMDWSNDDLLTKEEAFYDQSYRYEAVTKYFNEQSFYYSNLPPSNTVSSKLKPYTDYLLTELFPNYSIFRCQIVCLKPGQNVYPHIDPRYYHTYGKRIHLPLQINDNSFHIHFDTNNNYDMIFSKMTEGIITDFDNITPHSAFNYGETDRIHIICDIVKNSIITQLEDALGGNPNATNEKNTKEYYTHLKNIETRYNCRYQDLKPFYLEKMYEYKQTNLQN
jgi:hypothetical protein